MEPLPSRSDGSFAKTEKGAARNSIGHRLRSAGDSWSCEVHCTASKWDCDWDWDWDSGWAASAHTSRHGPRPSIDHELARFDCQ
jgi:hypothetical protein